MSTRDLSRTLVEGGRTGYSKGTRRARHSIMRSRYRDALSHVRSYKDAVAFEDPDETTVDWDGISFADKLAPLDRYLHRQVGRPWDKVRGELRQRFDVRKTKGRHLLVDHIDNNVTLQNDPFWIKHGKPYGFYVDKHGILRHAKGPW